MWHYLIWNFSILLRAVASWWSTDYNVLLVLAYLVFQTRFASVLSASSLHQGLSPTHFSLWRSIEFLNHCFLLMQWNPDGPDLPGTAVILDTTCYSNSFFFRFVCFIVPSRWQWSAFLSIENLFLKVFICFEKMLKFVYYIGIGILIGQKRQRNAISIGISGYSSSSFSWTTALISSIRV